MSNFKSNVKFHYVSQGRRGETKLRPHRLRRTGPAPATGDLGGIPARMLNDDRAAHGSTDSQGESFAYHHYWQYLEESACMRDAYCIERSLRCTFAPNANRSCAGVHMGFSIGLAGAAGLSGALKIPACRLFSQPPH